VIALGDHGFERQKSTMEAKGEQPARAMGFAPREGATIEAGAKKKERATRRPRKTGKKRFGKYPKNTGSWP